MNSDSKPPQNKKKANPPTPSFLSLPQEIVVSCLARISKSYYPKISLVCKTFCSLLLSRDLCAARLHLGTHENLLHVCLQLPTKSHPSWFSLWIKPNQTLTNDIVKKKKSSGNTLLVPIPSLYSPRVPMFKVTVGSELYAINKYNNIPSSDMWVRRKSTYAWCKAPSMTVARANAVACVFDEKIYVMGGCESTNWAEVFDPKTQTWEPLPDPGAELRLSSIKKVKLKLGKIYVRSIEDKEYVYDPKECKWEVSTKIFVTDQSRCVIENVWYQCGRERVLWFDIKLNEWRVVKGLDALNGNPRGGGCFIEIANYSGKLLILWGKFARQNMNIWCAVIALERRSNGDEVWGKVEWANIVLKVPRSHVFLRCEVNPV